MPGKNSGFSIEEAAPEDVEAVAPLFDEYRKFYGQPGDPAGARKFLRDRLVARQSKIFLAKREMNIFAFLQLYPSFSSVSMKPLWILNDLFVLPSARQSGAATALMERARQLAKDTGAEGLVLETAVDNAPAQKLYEKLGWKREVQFHRYNLDL